MARLASESKMGFYATSTKTIDKIINKAIDLKEKTFILDSCAGEGEVISHFKEKYGAYTYAIELNELRAKTLEEKKLIKSLNADALSGVRRSLNWVGFNFLNPPYDRAADGSRLEIKFVETYGNVTTPGGLMMLVINPSSADEEMAKKLLLQGYKPLFSVYDEENEDYKNFGQFFVILRRVRDGFRADMSQFREIFQNPVEIEEFEVEQKLSLKEGRPPKIFKEIEIPQWKLFAYLENSKLKKHFFDDLKKASLSGGSIELPNEGQAAILIAAGKLNEQIRLEDGNEIILKGTVKKERVDKAQMNDKGEIDKVKCVDVYKTVVYGLNLTQGRFVQFN